MGRVWRRELHPDWVAQRFLRAGEGARESGLELRGWNTSMTR
ncbi:hypothetical protein HMPREF9278_0935 [Mobiluncus mulieris FB024-16]|nr:hypothetical protein HMPREF9278_0935 [Mobiluncus mulieris FB024-16]